MRKVRNLINSEAYCTNKKTRRASGRSWYDRIEDGIGNFTVGYDGCTLLDFKKLKTGKLSRYAKQIDECEEVTECEGN